MKLIYSSETDILRILFSAAPVQESDENKPGVILDYDQGGNLAGMENPRSIEVEYAH